MIALYIDRRKIINAYIHEKGEVRLKELEKMFPEVSSMTLRRDLIYLENKGYIIRVRGGAKSISHAAGMIEDIYSLRATENKEAKVKIAKKAVKYIETGRSVYLDAGTTIMCLAKILPDEDLSIITSGPNIGLEIVKHTKPSVTLVGGQLNRNNLCTSGINALDFIKNINIDIAFLASSGFSLEAGFTCGNFNECELKRAVVNKARQKIMLMDTSKINRSMPFTFASLKDINILICESVVPEDIKRAAEENNVKLI